MTINLRDRSGGRKKILTCLIDLLATKISRANTCFQEDPRTHPLSPRNGSRQASRKKNRQIAKL
jgi:hypothetical protein